MEFKEFSNPESKDYDINSSLNTTTNNVTNTFNPYVEELINIIGILEDVTEEDLQEQYGISMNEYLNPDANTIKKIEQRLNNPSSGMHR